MLEFDKTGKMVNKMLMRKDFIFSIGLITQSHENDYLIRPLEGDKICYKVDQGEIKPYVKIDFKDKSIPTYYIFDSQKQVNTDKYMFSDYYKVPIYLHETKEILYFSFAVLGHWKIIVFSHYQKTKEFAGKETSKILLHCFCISF